MQNSKDAFLPHMEQTSQVLLKLFQTDDEDVRQNLEANDVLGKCSETWASMVSILAKKGRSPVERKCSDASGPA